MRDAAHKNYDKESVAHVKRYLEEKGCRRRYVVFGVVI